MVRWSARACATSRSTTSRAAWHARRTRGSRPGAVRSRLAPMRLFALAFVLLASSACARHEPVRPTTPPNDHAAWRHSLDRFAGALFIALRDNRLDPVLVSFRDLD